VSYRFGLLQFEDLRTVEGGLGEHLSLNLSLPRQENFSRPTISDHPSVERCINPPVYLLTDQRRQNIVPATDNTGASERLVFLYFALAYFYNTAVPIDRDVRSRVSHVASRAAGLERR